MPKQSEWEDITKREWDRDRLVQRNAQIISRKVVWLCLHTRTYICKYATAVIYNDTSAHTLTCTFKKKPNYKRNTNSNKQTKWQRNCFWSCGGISWASVLNGRSAAARLTFSRCLCVWTVVCVCAEYRTWAWERKWVSEWACIYFYFYRLLMMIYACESQWQRHRSTVNGISHPASPTHFTEGLSKKCKFSFWCCW